MVAVQSPIDKVVDFLASIPQPAQIMSYQLDDEDILRYQELADANRTRKLSVEETEELQAFLFVQNLMVLAKKRAHRRMTGS